MATMIAPAPYFQVQAPSATYTADAAGIITGVASNDILALRGAGCEQIGLGSGITLIGRLLGANMNITTDQAIPLFNGSQSFRITSIVCKNASTSLTTAAGGIYTAVSKGGSAITAAAQAYSGITAVGTGASSALTLAVVLAITFECAATQGLWLSLTTGQGAAATADFFLYGELGS
jgi:hypothetical protein